MLPDDILYILLLSQKLDRDYGLRLERISSDLWLDKLAFLVQDDTPLPTAAFLLASHLQSTTRGGAARLSESPVANSN